MNHSHQFTKIAERYFAYTLNLTDDSAGGLIERLNTVMPAVMPDNEVLIYQWLPPRKDGQGQPTEVKRLRIFRVPVSKDGPRIADIVKCLDEAEAPKSVRMPEPLDIPAEISSVKDEGELEVLAARLGMTFPAGADTKVKHVLLAREVGSPRGKELFKNIKKRPAPEPVRA